MTDPTLDELLTAYQSSLAAFVRRRMGRLAVHESVADTVQSVCRDLLDQRDRFEYRGEAEFRAWLFECARHHCLDKIRRVDADKRGGRADQARLSDEDPLVSPWPSPSHLARQSEIRASIATAIDRLDDIDRELVRQHYLQGVELSRVARRLDLSYSAAKMRLLRARAELSGYLPG